MASYGKRYDTLIREGKQLNPPPPRTGKRGRPALGPAGSLLARLETHRIDVLRFAADFTVPFDNGQAERDVRMVKLQQKICRGWRSDTGAEAFLDVRPPISAPPASTARAQRPYSATCSPVHRSTLDARPRRKPVTITQTPGRERLPQRGNRRC